MAKTKAKTKKKVVRKKAAPTASTLVGKSVPKFALEATGGRPFTPENLSGHTTVLYFYPKDATPGCTVEGQDFTKLHKQFEAANAQIFGVSRDSMKSHEKFRANQKYSFDLVSDEDEKLCKIFDVIKMKNMYGRKVRGIERSTFVIGSDGKVVKEWRGVRVPGHAEEVLEFVRSL